MLTPSGILGLMSCKMRWLQLTCTDAHTSLPHPLPALPPSTPSHPSPDTQLFLFQEAPSLISRPLLAVPVIPKLRPRWLGMEG